MKEFTAPEAWADFWQNVKPDIWAGLSPRQKNELHQANRAANGKIKGIRRPVGLGTERLRRLLETYAPGRYRFESIIYLNEPS